MKRLIMSFLSGCLTLAAQGFPAPTVVVIDVDYGLFYSRDTADWTKYATEPGPITAATARNFQEWEGLGDIVAVNGRRMRGTWHARAIGLRTSPTPTGGIALADVTRTGTLEWIMEILDPDNNRLCCIMGYGWNGSPGPLGGDSRMTNLEMTITGGTGAFVGIRGQMAFGTGRVAMQDRPVTSMVEDPAYRRQHGTGQTRRHVLQIYPLFVPTIDRVLHADFSLVTNDRPARPGETLILLCSNLGPVRPNVEFGKPFPGEPYAVVNAPVDVVVNGQEIAATNKIGMPGQVNQYRVDVLLPAGLPAGETTLRVRAAFLDGIVLSLPVRQ